jgi:hypothetical protein
MADGELSIVRYTVISYFQLLLNSNPFSPSHTKLINLVTALISSEPEPDPIVLERVNWIYNNTHEKVNIPLAIIELAVYRNLDKGLNRELDIGNKTFVLTELYKYLNEVTIELTKVVIKVATRYSIDISFQPLNNRNSQFVAI